MSNVFRIVASLLFLALAGGPSAAQTSVDREAGDAISYAYARGVPGPATIPFRELASLQLPKDLMFIPGEAGRRLMHGMGNATADSLLGLIVPMGAYGNWYIAVNAFETGHVTRDTVAKLDLLDVHAAIRSAVRRGNDARMQLGSGPLDVGAWVEPPKQDAAKHRFTGALRIFESGPSTTDEDATNVQTYIFGRTHTLEVSLMTSHADSARRRAIFERVVDGLAFAHGHRAEDFVAGQDKIATHVVDVVFGGRTLAELAAEAAEDAAAAKRRAAMPRGMDAQTQMKLLFFGLLGVVALVLVMFALRGGRSGSASGSRAVRRVSR